MDWQEQLKDIKTQFRLAMNGAVSASMRRKGMDYRINFGIELPRLKEIAARYPKDHRLAQALWKEEVRESKILAALLQPVESFIPELADIWVEEMCHPEIAALTCMNLFQYLPYASGKAFEWIADERPYFQACGYYILAHLFAKGKVLNERSEDEYLDQAAAAVQSPPSLAQRAAWASLQKFVQGGAEQGRRALQALSGMKSPDKPERRALYEALEAAAEEEECRRQDEFL